MLDVHVLTPATRSRYAGDLSRFAALGHRPRASGRRWLSHAAGDRGDDAVELLAYGGRGAVAGCRLTPLGGLDRLSSRYRELPKDRPVPQTRECAELSAMSILPAESDRDCVEDAMWCAAAEWCVEEGIGWLCAAQSAWELPRRAAYGWQPEPLGLPRVEGDRSVMDVMFPVDAAALAGVRRAAMVHRRQLVRPFRPVLAR